MEIKKFLGLGNTVAPERNKPGVLEVARNVDVDNSYALRSRRGLTQVSGTAAHSLWASGRQALLVMGGDLRRMAEDGSFSTLARLTYDAPLSYVEADGVVYYSNGVDTGRVVGGAAKLWGVRRPVQQPPASAGYGLLPPARYLYAVTYLRLDGQESGTPEPALIELQAQGGITLSPLPTSSDPDVIGLVLYLSAPNGSELYRAAAVPLGASSYSYGNAGLDLSYPLSPDPVEPAPAGTILEWHAGVIYVVDGDVAWASDQFSYERFRRAGRFLRVPGQITLFAAVTGGIYVGTPDATWFFEGTDPEAMKVRQVLTYGAVPGTAVKFDGEELLSEDERTGASDPNVLWTSTNGVIIGDSSGQVKNMTEEMYSLPTATRGAAMFRVDRGYSSYVVSLQGNGAAPNEYE